MTPNTLLQFVVFLALLMALAKPLGEYMGKVFQGEMLGQGRKFAVVISRFNEFITSRLLGGAQDVFSRHGVAEDDVDVIWVPGSFEIPITALRAAQTEPAEVLRYE